MFIQMKKLRKCGFTIVEVMVTTFVLVVAICGLLGLFLSSIVLNETSRNASLATQAAQARLEELKNVIFSDLSTYNNTAFAVSGFGAGLAKGRVEVSDTIYNTSDYNLKKVHISVSWKQNANRIVGEDINLDGAYEVSEDKNNNGEINSPAEIYTFISN
jgi:Tfp pilus assembly protein PilV